MDKKAAWGNAPALIDWIALVIIILIIVFATVLFSVQREKIENRYSEVSATQDANYLIINLFRTRAGNMKIIDLVSLWYLDPEYSHQLKEEISNVLNSFYGGELSWVLEAGDKKLEMGRSRTTMIADVNMMVALRENPEKLFIPVTIKVYVNKIEEGKWCFNPAAEACSIEDELCKCDRVSYKLVWTNCIQCTGKCDPVKQKCI